MVNVQCPHCGLIRKNVNYHVPKCKLNPFRKSVSNQYIKARELGLEPPKLSEEIRTKIKKNATGRRHTEETKRKLSKIAKAGNYGGHISKKCVFYKTKGGLNVYLQSSYELRFAQLLDELNIEWSRPEPFNWVDEEGNSHRYYPDFKIGHIYIDTKNDYLAKKDLPKINSVIRQNKIDLRIVTEKNINIVYIASLV